MIEYTALKTDVIGLLQIDTDDSDKFSIDTVINSSQDHLLNTLPARFLTNAIRTYLGNLEADVWQYQFQTGYIRLLTMDVDYSSAISDTNDGIEVRLVDDRSIKQIANVDLLPSTEHPIISLGAEGGFELRPMPLADQTHGYRMRYIQRLPVISSTQNCLMRRSLRNLLMFYAAAIAAMINNYSAERSGALMALYTEELKTLLPKYDIKKEVL